MSEVQPFLSHRLPSRAGQQTDRFSYNCCHDAGGKGHPKDKNQCKFMGPGKVAMEKIPRSKLMGSREFRGNRTEEVQRGSVPQTGSI